jgi:hypothetical protein
MSEIDHQLTDLAAICLSGFDRDAVGKLQETLNAMREAMAAEARKSPPPPAETDPDGETAEANA